MISKEEVDQALENYEKLVTRAQHVYNRLYTELYTKYSDKYWSQQAARLKPRALQT